MKTIHIAIQDEQCHLYTEDTFDFDEMLGVCISMMRGVMERAAGDDLVLKKELYSRVNYQVSSMLTEYIPDSTWLKPAE